MVRRSLGGLSGLCLLACFGVLAASDANAGPRNLNEYCIRGSGDGTPWDWEIQESGLPVAAEMGLSVSGTADDVRDEFVASINARSAGAPPWLFAQETAALPPSCLSSDARFYIAGQNAFDLYVTNSGGTLILVGPPPTGTVSFNPDISLVPEPGATLLLASGCIALAILDRARKRWSGGGDQ